MPKATVERTTLNVDGFPDQVVTYEGAAFDVLDNLVYLEAADDGVIAVGATIASLNTTVDWHLRLTVLVPASMSRGAPIHHEDWRVRFES